MTTFGEDLVANFQSFSCDVAGEILPINYIDTNGESGLIGHTVADNKPAIKLKNGDVVRVVCIRYPLSIVEELGKT